MLINFRSEPQSFAEVLAFGLDSYNANVGLVPMEARENDLVCKLSDERNLYVVLRQVDDRYAIIGRAPVTEPDQSRSLTCHRRNHSQKS
jgi:hypothetical protein